MASPELLDFARLLAPIPGDNPAGGALREESALVPVYFKIKDARTAARAAERKALFPDEGDEDAGKTVDWSPILDQGIEILAERSKDLEIAAWVTEALVRLSGCAGLRDGFRLARELVEQFWDGIYPRPDEDGVATTVAPFGGLDGGESEGALIRPIALLQITEGTSEGPFTQADYRQALEVEQIGDPEKKSRRIEEGAVSLSAFNRAVAETSAGFFQTLLDDLAACLDEFSRLDKAFEEKCGKDASGYPLAPPTSNIRNALVAFQDAVKSVSKDVLARAGSTAAATAGDDGSGLIPVEGNGAAARGGVIRTRDDAFQALLQVAAFFKQTEPHSPVSYALEQAVRWGRMSLPELLTELIPDVNARDQLFRHVGIVAVAATQGEPQP